MEFTDKDRKENIRRIGHVARLMYDAGFIVLCSFISPKREMRQAVRNLLPRDAWPSSELANDQADGSFSEVYVKCDIVECKRRDPKGWSGLRPCSPMHPSVCI